MFAVVSITLLNTLHQLSQNCPMLGTPEKQPFSAWKRVV